MSFLMHLYYTGQNGNARRFAEDMEQSGLADAIRHTDGCLRYEYFYPAADPETVLLIDQWRDEESLVNHHQSERMAKIAALRDKYDLHMRVERFVPAALPEENGAFIRK